VVALYFNDTVCPRSLGPFYLVTSFIKWVKTSCTDSSSALSKNLRLHIDSVNHKILCCDELSNFVGLDDRLSENPCT